MKRLKELLLVLVVCVLVAWTAQPAKAQIGVKITGSGLSPSSAQVKTGTTIFVAGIPKRKFYNVTVTSAPAGTAFSEVGRTIPYLAQCGDFELVADVPGTYTYIVDYGGTYSGSVTAVEPTPTYYAVHFGSTGITPSSIAANAGDNITFTCDNSDAWKYTEIHWTSDPSGSLEAITGAGLLCEETPVTLTKVGTYNYDLRYKTSTFQGSIITNAAAASVANNSKPSGFSMRVTPEPSNGVAAIKFTADKQMGVKLALFDATGKQVHQYEDVNIAAGEQSVPLASTGLLSGDYFLRASSGAATLATTKVLIVR